MKFIIYGHRGYLGQHFNDFLTAQGDEVVLGDADIGDVVAVREELTTHHPDFVINCAGKTGRPNVDWCEDNKEETVYGNVTGPLVLMQVCSEVDAKLVHLGSGCIYDGDNEGSGFAEDDAPNFDGSFYSKTKTWAETILDEFPVLQLRLRMPIDANDGERNFVTKILKYDKVINEPNSMTVIEDFLPAAYELMKKGASGIYNMTNPGLIDHKTILDMYKEEVDPEFEYDLITVEQLYGEGHVRARRSNCKLNSSKLEREGIQMRPIEEAIRDCLVRGFKK